MLPPVLEIYVLWHPGDDHDARPFAEAVIDHFHGDTFSGLLGGAIEVYVRSKPWASAASSPRPIPLPGSTPTPTDPAAFVAVVPLVGAEMTRAVRDDQAWKAYLEGLCTEQQRDPEHILMLPAQLRPGTALPPCLGPYQTAAAENAAGSAEDRRAMLERDLTQALAQHLKGSSAPIQVFVSHTKRADQPLERSTHALIETVRSVLRNTRLGEFFDANSIQPGKDWADYLVRNAGTGAMLALRSELYAGREWCHREVKEAKTEGVPVVVLDALQEVERRGSFLLDHVPRVAVRPAAKKQAKAAIRTGLGLLVDECLKRELWKQQEELAKDAGLGAGIDWWAPHAPEPLTLAPRLKNATPNKGQMLILHPDPPLTESEQTVLKQIAELKGLTDLEVLTPRTLAARGGS